MVFEVDLAPDEHIEGRYVAQALRMGQHGWVADIMQLQVRVTNMRLLLKPFPQRYDAASLPASFLTAIETQTLGGHSVATITFRTGQQLHLLLAPTQLTPFIAQIRALLVPRPPDQFDSAPPQREIQRLIDFFGGTLNLKPG
jgi:hypothetical protein